LDNLPPDEVTEEVRLGGFRDVFQIVDLALAQSVEHEIAVVVKGDEIHLGLALSCRRLGRRLPQSALETVDREQDLAVEFDQGGAVLAEAAVVLGEATEMGGIAGRQRTQAGLAALGPGKHGGGVQGTFRGGAVAGRFAAAGFQFIDGALEEQAEGQQVFEALLVISQPLPQRLAEAAGALGRSGHGSVFPLCHIS
jgi:hypothetical protein